MEGDGDLPQLKTAFLAGTKQAGKASVLDQSRITGVKWSGVVSKPKTKFVPEFKVVGTTEFGVCIPSAAAAVDDTDEHQPIIIDYSATRPDEGGTAMTETQKGRRVKKFDISKLITGKDNLTEYTKLATDIFFDKKEINYRRKLLLRALDKSTHPSDDTLIDKDRQPSVNPKKTSSILYEHESSVVLEVPDEDKQSHIRDILPSLPIVTGVFASRRDVTRTSKDKLKKHKKSNSLGILGASDISNVLLKDAMRVFETLYVYEITDDIVNSVIEFFKNRTELHAMSMKVLAMVISWTIVQFGVKKFDSLKNPDFWDENEIDDYDKLIESVTPFIKTLLRYNPEKLGFTEEPREITQRDYLVFITYYIWFKETILNYKQYIDDDIEDDETE